MLSLLTAILAMTAVTFIVVGIAYALIDSLEMGRMKAITLNRANRTKSVIAWFALFLATSFWFAVGSALL